MTDIELLVDQVVSERMTRLGEAIDQIALLRVGLTLKEAAACVGLGTTKLKELINAGEIPAVKLEGKILVRRAALEDWMRARESKGAEECEPDTLQSRERPSKRGPYRSRNDVGASSTGLRRESGLRNAS